MAKIINGQTYVNSGIPVLDMLNSALNSKANYGSTWFGRVFDPSGSSMKFNALEAEKTRNFNAQEAQLARDFNAEQAQLARDFEREMSNTAYQRQVEDMQKAGLNPYLLYANGGSGASTPSGTVLSSPTASASSASVNAGTNNGLLNLVGTAINVLGKIAMSKI